MANIETKYAMRQKVFVCDGSNSVYRPRIVHGIRIDNDGVYYNLTTRPGQSNDWHKECHVYTREQSLSKILQKHREELTAFFAAE